MADLRRIQSRRRRPGGGDGGSDLPRPLPDGTRLHSTVDGREGEILEHARQYAHPQADPVFHYLVRWEDGQVQALAEAAFAPGRGIDVLDAFDGNDGD